MPSRFCGQRTFHDRRATSLPALPGFDAPFGEFAVRDGSAGTQLAVRRSCTPMQVARRSKKARRRSRQVRATHAEGRPLFQTPHAEPVQRRSRRARAVVLSCCARRSWRTARECARTACLVHPSRRADPHPPSDSLKNMRQCLSRMTVRQSPRQSHQGIDRWEARYRGSP